MQLVVIAHNIRSTHNVGSILRTCDGFGVKAFYATGYTPYPEVPGDTRLPHVRQKITKDIHKTALGAEATVEVRHVATLAAVAKELTAQGFTLVALEQSPISMPLHHFSKKALPQKLALILGNEVEGLSTEDLKLADQTVEIQMFGRKESFNVSVAAGIALYELTKSS